MSESEQIDEIMLVAEDKMEKTLLAAAENFAAIRTGRANPALFAKLMVDYYGSATPLQQLASLAVPEARTVLITPYDKSALHAIEKAIRDSDLGVNPADDGNVIRLNLPELTAERRKEYVKLARTRAEEARIALRAVRRKAKEELEKLTKDGEIGEDESHRALAELDEKTRAHAEQIDEQLQHKEAELLEV